MDSKTWPLPGEYSIDRVNFRGEGITLPDGGTRLRIANALEGERVLAVEISARRRRMGYLVEVIAPSPLRRPPQCPHWRDCGACQFQCLEMQAQQSHKRSQWLRLIEKFASVPVAVDFVPAPLLLGYRHRMRGEFMDGRLSMPLRPDAQAFWCDQEIACAAESPRSIPLSDCVLHAPALREATIALEGALASVQEAETLSFGVEAALGHVRITVFGHHESPNVGRRVARHITNCLGVSVICQILPPRGSHVYPEPESFGHTPWQPYDINAHGETLWALKGAWTPVNPINAHIIRDQLSAWLGEIAHPVSRVLELGCGCGTHACVFDALGCCYHGIDASWPAIQSAQHNAATHGWQDKTFQTSTARHYLDKNYYRGARADIILMHSNRLPYGHDVATLCQKFGARTMLIVAPTAYAMAQEIRHFLSLGYRLTKLALCDTLPMTYHMMAVAMLQN